MSRDPEAIELGREAFSRRAWLEAYRRLSEADDTSQLEPDDLERLAIATYLTGKDTAAIALWKRLHQQLLDAGEAVRAARWSFWLSLRLLLNGEAAQSAGWLARTERLLENHPGCAEIGLVHIVSGLVEMGKGNADAAIEQFELAREIAARFADPDLMAFRLLGHGEALVQKERPAEGVLLLDEAMVTVTSGAVSPMAAGIVYCAVILTSQRIFDLRRATEWTAALNEWCLSQPEMVPFRGQCLIHRSEILQLQGDWSSAMEEAKRSCEWFVERAERTSGRAFYQLGELHRLRGEYEAANEMYREAGRNGTEPQPGLSLLRLAEGDLDAAVAAIRRLASETEDRQGPRAGTSRISVLAPYVEIMLAANDVAAARAGAEKLAAVANAIGAPMLRAQSSHAVGAVCLAEGEPSAALIALREAWALWQELEAPYEAARVRVLIGRACEQLGDRDTAQSHLDAARSVFERLGAAPALSELDEPGPELGRGASELTGRELEVLALVASGKTNRQIAAELFISEHTVARHLSNIFDKLDVTSRTAAAAFALEKVLLRGSHGQD